MLTLPIPDSATSALLRSFIRFLSRLISRPSPFHSLDLPPLLHPSILSSFLSLLHSPLLPFYHPSFSFSTPLSFRPYHPSSPSSISLSFCSITHLFSFTPLSFRPNILPYLSPFPSPSIVSSVILFLHSPLFQSYHPFSPSSIPLSCSIIHLFSFTPPLLPNLFALTSFPTFPH